MDSSFKLGDKILPNGNKAQSKRINARAEYLLKVLKKQIDFKLGVVRSFCIQYITDLTSSPSSFYFYRVMSSSYN